MTRITDIRAREIMDSRGNLTVEADVMVDGGLAGRAAVPSGASTGSREAVESARRRQDAILRQGRPAVANVNGPIREALLGRTCSTRWARPRLIALDGTDTKSRLGANAARRVSLAAAHAAAGASRQSLTGGWVGPVRVRVPVPMMNIVNGGAHADNSVDIQEFMVLRSRASSFRRRCGSVKIFHTLRKVLHERGLAAVGDEGGLRPTCRRTRRRWNVLEAVERAGFKAGRDVYLGLDVASSGSSRTGILLDPRTGNSPPRSSPTISRASPAAIPSSPSRTAWRSGLERLDALLTERRKASARGR